VFCSRPPVSAGQAGEILITEDEDSLRIFVARALRLEGHETVEAPDGAAGLDALTEGGFDLLLSDIRMPVMDGIELAHKASAAHPALKILLMTGYAEQRERAAESLAAVGLRGFEDVPCHTLSAGQQRRVALARLYLPAPPLWILDEPFTALDKHGVAQLERHLASHCEQGGLVILTTHHNLQDKPAGYRELDLGQIAA